MGQISIIAGREYRERVVKKSFILTTLLMPVLMALLMGAPALVMYLYSPGDKVIAVADRSGFVADALSKAQIDGVEFRAVPDADKEVAIGDEQYDGVLTIPADVADNPRATLYLHGSGSWETEGAMRRALNHAIQEQRLKAYDVNNLQQILDETRADTSLQTVKIDADTGDESGASTGLSYVLGLVLGLLLYFVLMMYGQMIMNSVIEEKSSRVLDLMITSVKPFNLMVGKLLGVGAVAVTQIVVWGVMVCLLSAFLMPALMSPEMAADVAALKSGASMAQTASGLDLDMLQGAAVLGEVGYMVKIFFFLMMFLIGGFMFYAAIYAAIGSAVDNIQDASQLSSITMAPILLCSVFDLMVAQYPDTTLALVLSFIPFTSPVIVMTRIAYDIPSWQLWVSLAILFGSAAAMTWFAAKIYRVGILMHGSKPSLADLYRWSKYK